MDEIKIKGFFERPEGKMGMVFIVILSFTLFFVFDKILPIIIRILENAIYTGFLIAGILLIIFLVTNRQVQNLISNLFRNLMRAITGLIITIDPIGIMKNYIEDMKAQIHNMEMQIVKLNSEKFNVMKLIKERKNVAEECARMAKISRNKGHSDQFTINNRKMQRAIDFVNKLETTLEKMNIIYRILDKMQRNVKLLLEDTKDEVQTREVEYKAIKSAHFAMSSARKLISGDQKKDLFEQSMEFLANDIANKVGEMDRIMHVSTDFMNSIDLQNGVWDDKGLEILEKIEAGGSLFKHEEKRSDKMGLSSNFKTDQKEFFEFFNN